MPYSSKEKIKYCCMLLWHGLIQHNIKYTKQWLMEKMDQTFNSQKYTLYDALMGDLWGIYYKYFWRKLTLLCWHCSIVRLTEAFLYTLLRLRHNIAATLCTTFLYVFYWMKTFDFQMKIPWNIFLQVSLTVNHHWFKYWLGTKHVTHH